MTDQSQGSLQNASPQSPADRIVPGKGCGTCTMCCKVFRIPEVEKNAGQWCRHVLQGKGCAIHETRPQTCRDFFCHWLVSPVLGPEWRPDTAKFVLYTEQGGQRLVVAADPGSPAAWRRQPYLTQLQAFARAGLEQGRQVIVFNGKMATGILPGGDVSLGNVEVGDEIYTEQSRLANGAVEYRMVVRRAEV